MADIKAGESPSVVPIDQSLHVPPSTSMAVSTEVPDELFEDGDEQPVSAISVEDGESLIGLSMSRVATRLKSAQTPAIEKENILEDGGEFESDPETPPAVHELETNPASHQSLPLRANENVDQSSGVNQSKNSRGLSLGGLPPINLEPPTNTGHVSPWSSGPRQMIVHRSTTPHSLAAVFGSGTDRKRSLSGGADALRKLLPKGLPSMAQVGNLFGTSSNSSHRKLGSTSFSKDSSTFRSGTSSVPTGSPGNLSPLPRTVTVPSQEQADKRPGVLRRVTSDDSMLYHSLSRASSLGDDSRFEDHREQVNSRVKAIRDSLQDRSSFRMPNLPNMPSMIPRVPSFGFNMNFLNNNNIATAWKSDTDMNSDLVPGTVAKKMLSVGHPKGHPEPSIESHKPVPEGSNTKYLDRAIESLVGDIVIMGGYRGSILRSTKTNRQVWVPIKVGMNIRKVNLEVGLEPEDEEKMAESIYASGMLQNVGPVDISKRLFKRLSESENAKNGKLRVWDYGYDWRLSPHLLSKRLIAFLETLPSNKPNQDGSINENRGALVIAHSLGGVITRHVVNTHPDLFSGVIYAGVPQSCINILGPIRNGDAVLLSSRVLTAQVNFTLRTSFVLLPEDGSCFVDINTKEKYPVDFFDLDTWIKLRLSPCTDPPLPPWSQSHGLGSILSGSLLSLPLPGKKSSSGLSQSSRVQSDGPAHGQDSQHHASKTTRAADVVRGLDKGNDRTIAPQMGHNTSSSVSMAVTIPRDKAITYLRRTLAETKKYKQELHFRPELSESNRYPPLAVIYAKNTPTCRGAFIHGMESVPHADVYDNLAFASGDGVCLAKEAMLPEGYKYAYGGRIRSERGHVTLLGDLNAVGRAIEAVSAGRSKGIGLGVK